MPFTLFFFPVIEAAHVKEREVMKRKGRGKRGEEIEVGDDEGGYERKRRKKRRIRRRGR